MKKLIVLGVLSLSLVAFAGVDNLIGKYRMVGGKGTAEVVKELVVEADLFNPAQYEYRLNVESEKDDVYFERTLTIARGGNALELSWSGGDCDNPDCHELTDLEATVTKDGARGARIDLSYTGFDRYDGDPDREGDFEFSGEMTFKKR